MLVKTARVYDLEFTGGEGIQFVQRNDDTGEIDTLSIIEKDTWLDMGAPYQITLTIEPGDRLNDE